VTSPIRPGFNPSVAPAAPRVNARAAFFQAAVDQAAAPAAPARPAAVREAVRPAAPAPVAAAAPPAPSSPPERLLRPGSLLDIRV
jgi:hypothetical protein